VQESLGNPQAAARVFNSLKAGCRSLESKYSVYIDIDDAEFACDDERVESHLSTGLNNTRLPLIVRFVQEGTGSEFSWMADFRGVDAG